MTMRTRSSGPAKDPLTGAIFPDSPQSTIPAFIHEPVPFNPFPEAAFPTLEFPVPQPQNRYERPRRIARSNRRSPATSSQGSSPVSHARSQRGAQGEIGLAQGVAHSDRPDAEENESTLEEASIPRAHPERVPRWIAPHEPGIFVNDPYWTDNNELKSDEENMDFKEPTEEKKTYEVIPTWSSLTPGVKIVAMTEMVKSFGVESAPERLDLTPEEINDYIDLQDSELQGQAAEDEKIRQYSDLRFQEMLAGNMDGSDSMNLLDLQFSQGSLWEPATFAMKKVDLKAGSRFLLSLGYAIESANLWQYYGVNVSIGYYSSPPGPTATNGAENVDSSSIDPTINTINGKITGQSDQPEYPGIEVQRRRQSVPKATRNLLLEKVKKPKKSRPPKRNVSLGSEPYSPAHTPSKLRMSISVDDVLSEEPTDVDEESPMKARVARQVKPGTDLSKPVKYTKPARQWADVPNSRRGSKEQHMRKQKPREAPETEQDYADLIKSERSAPITTKQKNKNGTYHIPPSEDAWFAPTRGSSKLAAAREMMHKALADDDHPGLSVVTNVAGFANPLLAAKWAKKTKPTDDSKADEAPRRPAPTPPSTLDPGSNGANGFSDNEAVTGTSAHHRNKPQRPKRETITADELLSPFDASTPGPASNGQKWKEGMGVITRQLSIQQQYVADEGVPIEMLNAGEQIMMVKPRAVTRTIRKSNGSETTGEGRNGKGEGTKGKVLKRKFSIPKHLMHDPEDNEE
ncbi:hypothetical protein O988_06895 [Pseudogymnoascus sp. VKM F-3808]|nr:hypothetical protein O988_06895 [Pseudogymnoascus sp. VKM F-3808]